MHCITKAIQFTALAFCSATAFAGDALRDPMSALDVKQVPNIEAGTTQATNDAQTPSVAFDLVRIGPQDKLCALIGPSIFCAGDKLGDRTVLSVSQISLRLKGKKGVEVIQRGNDFTGINVQIN